LELGRLEPASTRLTLITSRPFISTVRTGTFHVSVREEPVAVLAEKLLHYLQLEQPFLMELEEEFLSSSVVKRFRGTGEVVELNAEIVKTSTYSFVIFVSKRLWRHPLLLSLDCDWYSVFISSADVQNVYSLGLEIPDIYVCREIGSSQVTEMNISVRVRKSCGN
jgi:hypothetical protein